MWPLNEVESHICKRLINSVYKCLLSIVRPGAPARVRKIGNDYELLGVKYGAIATERGVVEVRLKNHEVCFALGDFRVLSFRI